MKKKEPLQIIGIIMVIFGAIILMSAFPNIPLSTVSFGSVVVTDIPAISATRIFIGMVMIILGFVAYFGKEGLKLLSRLLK